MNAFGVRENASSLRSSGISTMYGLTESATPKIPKRVHAFDVI
jgi:hypothetical protein